ncbi:hypothetical protein D3C72_691590 [compost metagenome]
MDPIAKGLLVFPLIGLIALQHVGFLVLEMFLWQKPFGRKVFGLSEEDAKTTAVLAGNQGLYNGFLAAGLVYAFYVPSEMFTSVATFFLACVLVAGIYGGFTASRKIWFVQALPALITLIILHIP